MYKLLLSFVFVLVSVTSAYAQSQTRLYCAYDYLRHCSAYPLDSNDLKRCMADIGMSLSPNCIKALVADGYITKQDVIDRAAKVGITVRDGPDGLYTVSREVLEAERVAAEQTAKVEEIEPNVVVEEDVGTETAKVIEEVVEEVKRVTKPVTDVIKKATKPITDSVKKAARAIESKRDKTYDKPVILKKNQYKAKKGEWKKPNKEYAKIPRIKQQDRIRKQKRRRDIVPEGMWADFGRYEARRPGYSRPKKKKTWIQHYSSGGGIRSSGIGGY